MVEQAAIALENARLYRDLEQREAEIRSLKDQQARRLSQAMDDLEYRKMKGAA